MEFDTKIIAKATVERMKSEFMSAPSKDGIAKSRSR
jgi:hypothetical protein